MKTSFATLLTLAAGAFASPIVISVGSDSVESTTTKITYTIESLTKTVEGYNGLINNTLAHVPVNPIATVQTEVIGQLEPKLVAITGALTSATKSATSSGFYTEAGQKLQSQVQGLVYEVTYTVKGVETKLGTTALQAQLHPLIAALGGLVKSLDVVVDGLLGQVQGIVGGVLGEVDGTLVSLL